MTTESFEAMLAVHKAAIERYVFYRIPNRTDAEDLLQEVYTAGFLKFHQLRCPGQYKSWMLAIARNKCNDYFRRPVEHALPLDEVPQAQMPGLRGRMEFPLVEEALAHLTETDRQMLDLFFWQELPQTEIAHRLGIPVGTVKSRLHTAKNRFQAHYPQREKGHTPMTTLPKILPEYAITPLDDPPFPVKWEECMGWLIVPKPGQRLCWGMYDHPSRVRSEYTDCQVVGEAEVHGIRGVEIAATQHDAENHYHTGSLNHVQRRFIVQLTDTHCRYLAQSHTEDGVRKFYTFLDGDEFHSNWGFGPDNCGTEVNQYARGLILRRGSVITTAGSAETMDIVGRYQVTIQSKTYDTVCLMDVESYDVGVATEQFLDKHGRTILWRRFNRNDWHGQVWTECLPDNERLTINGETYVHWYDCITDYIL